MCHEPILRRPFRAPRVYPHSEALQAIVSRLPRGRPGIVALVGALVGDAVFGVLERADYTRAWLLLLVALAVPFLAGSVDLYLRLHTP